MMAAMICAATAGQNGTDLRLNPEKNKVYRLRSTSDQTIVQTVNGNQQTIESGTSYTVSIKMIDATPSFLVTEVRFDTIEIVTNAMGKITTMSSASEGDIKSSETSDIVSNVLNRLSRNPLYAKIDFSGKVTEIVNSKMVGDMILKDTSAITLTDPAASAVKKQIIDMVSDNSLQNMIEIFTYYLPGKTINTGDKWSVTSPTVSGGMMLDITTSFILDGIKGKVANVTAESSIKPSLNAAPMESGGAIITYDNLRGLNKSTISIDISTGLVIESNAKARITGSMAVSVSGMNLDIPMDITSSSKITALQ